MVVSAIFQTTSRFLGLMLDLLVQYSAIIDQFAGAGTCIGECFYDILAVSGCTGQPKMQMKAVLVVLIESTRCGQNKCVSPHHRTETSIPSGSGQHPHKLFGTSVCMFL